MVKRAMVTMLPVHYLYSKCGTYIVLDYNSYKIESERDQQRVQRVEVFEGSVP